MGAGGEAVKKNRKSKRRSTKYWVCVCDTCDLHDSTYIKISGKIYYRSWHKTWEPPILAKLKNSKIPFEWVPIVGM